MEKLFNGPLGKAVDYFTAAISLSTVILFFTSTYVEESFDWFDILDFIVLLYYWIEFGVRFWSAPHSINFLIKSSSIVDLLCLWPIFFMFSYQPRSFLIKLIKITRVIRILKVALVANKHYKSADSEFSGVSQYIFILSLKGTITILKIVSILSSS